MNAILEQKRAAEPAEAPREQTPRAPRPRTSDAPRTPRTPRADAAQNTPVAHDTAVADHTPVTPIAQNTQHTYDTQYTAETHAAPRRRRRELTRLNLALDAELLRDMEDLAIVRGKKSLTALISDVMAAEIALSRDKIEAYRKIKG